MNPDHSLAVVLTGTTETADQSFSVKVTHKDGSTSDHTIDLDVSAGVQKGGWGTGDFYMLETDANDDVIIETGENHREIYISGSDDALTFKDIAALEGIAVNKVNAQWLAEHPEYGSSPDMALAEGAGMSLWKYTTSPKFEPTSNWLKFEAGYEYKNTGQLLQPKTIGESELHPLVITSYGDGEKPIIGSAQNSYPGGNIVIQDIEFGRGAKFQAGENILADDISVTDRELTAKNIDGFTLRNSDIIDVFREQHESNNQHNGKWGLHNDRISGFFANDVDGLLIEGLLVDHTGWADDYREDLSYEGGQPPSIYSQNLYLSWGNEDVTLRDSILMRGASFGAQVRSGGFIEDNVFLDNNAAVNSLGGRDRGSYNEGQYSLFSNNLITSGGHREAEGPGGALTMGIDNSGRMSTLVDNIVTHLADPNNPDEFAEKYTSHRALKNKFDTYHDDTIIHNWFGGRALERNWDTSGQNKDGLNENVLDQTTIQNFAADLLGKNSATINDLANYLRAQAEGALDDVVDADVIIAFFQQGFGLSTDLRANDTTLRFVPNDLGEGVRWDNRLNWDTGDLPGTQDGDSVDLGGNWVQYGGTTTLEDLTFGAGGKLYITHGYLEIEDYIFVNDKGATVEIDRAGQFWIDGYTDKDTLTVTVDGGRFANTGLFTGTADVTVSDNAQMILGTDGADFVLGDDSSLDIVGGNVRVGFDGEAGGTGVLLLSDDASLSFSAKGGELGTIEEFRSGHFDKSAPDIQSGINLGGGILKLDLSSFDKDQSLSYVLVELDEIIGTFGSLEVVGLGETRDLNLVIDYDADTVVLNIGTAGSGTGKYDIQVTGDASNAKDNEDLWEALTRVPAVDVEDPNAEEPDDQVEEEVEEPNDLPEPDPSEYGRIFDGSDRDNKFFGTNGRDYMIGAAGDDVLYGRSGSDYIDAGDGNDVLWGSKGNDTLIGGAGDDEIVSGFGHDLLSGGDGADVFVFQRDKGIKTIVDFAVEDRIDLRQLDLEIESFADLMSEHVSEVGSDVVIRSNITITLEDFALSSLSEDNFLF
ncbi:calcium-binding protein [Roseobacter sp. A03A-229]